MAESAGELMIRVTAMPTDLNPYGGVFGGWLMSQLALGASALATRRSGYKAILVGATDFAFPAAMAVGDELTVHAGVARTGRTSITIFATGTARERAGDAVLAVASGQFTFVALDENDRPTPIASSVEL
jgi:acyl-CoA thioesterase YciA